MGVKAIYFDLGNTLYDSKTPVDLAMGDVYASISTIYGILEIELRRVYSSFYPEKNVSKFFDGRGSKEYRKERFRRLLAEFEISDETLIDQLEMLYT